MKYFIYPTHKPNSGQLVYWYSYVCHEKLGRYENDKFLNLDGKWDGRYVKYWRNADDVNIEINPPKKLKKTKKV